MKPRNICIRESFDWIYVYNGVNNSLSYDEYDELCRYLNYHFPGREVIEIKFNKLRFINYVGYIQLSSVSIEILPKLSLSDDNDKDREILLLMLSKCGYFPVNLNEKAMLGLKEFNLMEIFASYYTELLFKELNRGVFHEYKVQEEDLNKIKGKLILAEHIRKNYADKTRVYCNFDEYTENNILNRILKLALYVLVKHVRDDKIQNNIKLCLAYLRNVEVNYITRTELCSIMFDRKNERFKNAYILAKFTLLNLSMEGKLGKNQSFSFLFEMNVLYEAYIGKLIKHIWNSKDRYTLLQSDEKYLLINTVSNRQNIRLRPDIIIGDANCEVIIDTKWKMISRNQRLNYEQSDIYQMYAYVTAYEKAAKCILLYPHVDSDMTYPKWRLNQPFGSKTIEVRTVRLDDVQNSMEDLADILGLVSICN